jgi:D-galactarolactone cycloisomerase
MRVVKVETIPIVVPLAETFRGSKYQMSERATLVTRLHTDEGIVGEVYNGDEVHTQVEIARIVREELFPLVEGRDPLLVEAAWGAMMPVTRDILRERKLVVMAMAAVDSALWDIVGKAAGLPLYKVWGGYRSRVPIIAIGGYYHRTHDELADEVRYYLDRGLGGCKMKVGGAAPEEDAERFLAMREAGGPGFVLMADANQGYTPGEALEFVRRIGPDAGLRWFEEPVRWENAALGMRDVRLKSGVPVAAGQSELARADARDLMRDGAIDVCNFDASWSGGPSEWRRVAGLAAAYGVEMAHHEEPQISAHLIASVEHGTYVECFHPDRDPVFWNLISNRSEPIDGWYDVPSGPGWGLELDWDYIDRYRVEDA